MFYKSSRYAAVDDCQYSMEGRIVAFKAIRIIPEVQAIDVHIVEEGERIDQIAYQHLRDCERFWKICDLNQSLWPPDLAAIPGSTILIPSPEV